MPFIDVTLIEGRSPELLDELVKELARTTSRVLNAQLEGIYVTVRELPPTHIARGDRTMKDIRDQASRHC